ncbi:MAG TPA: PA2779 family protein [Nitrospirota bacterium]|nr:PA2779 family protein [Nitrospirota bacterium]
MSKMKNIYKPCYAKPLALYLIMALIAISTLAGPAEAMYVSAAPYHEADDQKGASLERAADLARIQAAIESRIVRQKLMDYGLSPEDAMARVKKLSDDQIHVLASHTDSLQAGSDGVDLFFSLVVVALLVVILVFLLQGRIEIRSR